MQVSWADVDWRWPLVTAGGCVLVLALVVRHLARVTRGRDRPLAERVRAVEAVRRRFGPLVGAAVAAYVAAYAVAGPAPAAASSALVCAVVLAATWALAMVLGMVAGGSLHGATPAELVGPAWLRVVHVAVALALALATPAPLLGVPGGTALAVGAGVVALVWEGGLHTWLRVRTACRPLPGTSSSAPEQAAQAFAVAHGVELVRLAGPTAAPPYALAWVSAVPRRRWAVLNEPAGTTAPQRAFLLASGVWQACAPRIWVAPAWTGVMVALTMFAAPRAPLLFLTGLWVSGIAQSAAGRARWRRAIGPAYVEAMADCIGAGAAHEAMRAFAERSGTADLPAMRTLLQHAESAHRRADALAGGRLAPVAPLAPGRGGHGSGYGQAGSWVIDTTSSMKGSATGDGPDHP